jgi:hypothetical protein
LATALAVLGIEKGFELALDQGWAAYFIGRSEGAWISKATPAFADFVRAEPDTGNGEEPS